MNKKTFLCKTIASTMVLAGVVFPMSNDAVVKAVTSSTVIGQSSFTTNGEKNILTIKLTDKNTTLTKANLTAIVEKKLTDIKTNAKFTITDASGKTIENDNTAVGTGTIVKVSEDKEFVVVLLGDVNSDGQITTTDAQQLYNYITFEDARDKVLKNEYAKMAGDVYAFNGDDTEMNTTDAQRIYNYTIGGLDDFANKLPEDNVTEIEEYNYEFTVNGNNIINDTNSSASKIKITVPNGRVEEETEFELYYLNNNTNRDVKITTADLKIAQYANETDEIEVNLSSTMSSFTNSNTESEVTLKLKIKDSDEVVATTKVTVNRIHPEAVKVSARRDGTQNAGLKFEAKADSDIVKVYYIVATSNSVSGVSDFIDPEQNENVKSMVVENNKFDSILQNVVLENNVTNKVFFVVENKVGNLSSSVQETIVPNDTNGKVEGMVTNLSVDDDLKATWKAPEEGAPSEGYRVNVYDENGRVVWEKKKVTGTSQTLSSVINKAGKYSVTVCSNGKSDGDSSASEETEPVEFEVSQLAKVTGLQFVVDEEDPEKVLLKWDEYADKENEAFSSYTINVYSYNASNGTYTTKATYKDNIDKNVTEIELKNIASSSTFTANNNTRYKAEIIANSSKGKVVPSEPNETTKDYLKLNVNMTPSKKTDTEVSLTFNEITLIEQLGDEITYDVEVWSEKKSSTAESHYELADTRKNVAKDESGKLVVDGLEQGKTYKFVLVVHVDGDLAEGRTALSEELTVYKTLPSLEGLIVVKTTPPTKKEDTIGKVYTDNSTKIWINGEEVLFSKSTDYYDPDKLLNDDFAKNLVNSLNDGDTIVSITDEKVTIKSGEIATKGTARAIKAGGRILEIQGNKYEQDMGILVTDAKEVILTGSGALFKLDTTNTSPVKVSDGVKLISKNTSAVTVTILANATATINEIDISSSGDLEISETLNSTHTLKIKSAKNNTIDIRNHSGKELEVTLMDQAKLGDFQLGKITINSDAKVTVKSNSSSTTKVEADISVTTENGDIVITDNNLTGKKDVTVSAKENASQLTIKANTKLKAPIQLSNIEIMNYTFDQLKALKTSSSSTIKGSSLTTSMLNSCSDADLQAIVDYFNAFGSKLQAFGKAKVKVSKGAENVEITIPAESELTLAEIGGLK